MKSLGNFPDPFIAEISGQPEAIRRAASGLAEQIQVLEHVAAIGHERTDRVHRDGQLVRRVLSVGDGARGRGDRDPAHRCLGVAALPQERAGRRGPARHGESIRRERRGRSVDRGTRAGRPLHRFVVAVTNGTTTRSPAWPDDVLDTRTGDEVGPSTMTFAAALVVIASGRPCAAGRGAAGCGRGHATWRRDCRSLDRGAARRARRSPTSSPPGSAIAPTPSSWPVVPHEPRPRWVRSR